MSDENASEPGFWARQFAPEVTPQQTAFDVAFGILLPVVCLLADPIVFTSAPWLGGGVLAHYAVAAYLFLGGAILCMAFWLGTRRLPLLFAGPFFIGAAVALGVGTVLLPLSLAMMIVLIGLLGLVPFFTAFTFLRNGVRATHASLERSSAGTVATAALLIGCFVVAAPAAAQLHVKRRVAWAVDAVLREDSYEAGLRTLDRYGRFAPGVSLDQVVWRWSEEADPARKERLARAYERAAGRSIEQRWYELVD